MFICEECNHEEDYDEDENEIIECPKCGAFMFSVYF